MRIPLFVIAGLGLACTSSTSSSPTPGPEKEPAAKTEAPAPQAEPAPDEPPAPEKEPADDEGSPAEAEGSDEVADAPEPPKDRIAVELEDAEPLEIRVIDAELWVSDGTTRAPLRSMATSLRRVTRKTNAAGEPVLVVDYDNDMSCTTGSEREVFEVRNLLARLENARAMKAHRAKEYEVSAAGFARATGLDASFDVAWSNLACAEALRGRTAQAVAALRPLLDRQPLPTLHTVMTDPELTSIRQEPAITSHWAPEPGTVEIRDMTMAYSEHLGMVVLRRHEMSWGACNFVEDLRFVRVDTAKPVATLPLIGWSDSDPTCESDEPTILPGRRAKVNARLDASQRLLRRLGFSVSADLEVVEVVESEGTGTAVFTASFPEAGLGLAVGDRRARVLEGNEVRGTSGPIDAVGASRAGYDPTAGVAFVELHHSVPEGCASDIDGTVFEVFVVNAKAEATP